MNVARAYLAWWIACLVVPAMVWAHAEPISTSPARNAIVKTAPRVVSFTFGEPVTGTADAVRVYDRSGARVDDGDARHPGVDPKVYGVGLKPGVPRGTYTATYRVVSADTHVVTGGFSFSIGAAAAGGGASVATLLAGQRAGPVTGYAFTAARAVQYAAIAVGAGAVAFLLLVWLPAARGLADEGAARKAIGALVRVAAIAGVVSALLAIALEGAEAAGVSLWHAGGALGDVMSTRFGIVWLAAAVLWLLAALGARWALAPLVVLPALAGHASTEHPVWLFLPANVVHVVAMTLWLGGLVALVVVVLPLAGGNRTELLARAVGRFSPLALASVIALLATGIVQSLLEIDAWAELTQTAYGRAVLVKVALLLVLIGLGAINRQRSLPRIRSLAAAGAAAGSAGTLLRRALQAEVSVIAGVIVVSGALSAYTPAKDDYMPMTTVLTTLGPSPLKLTVMPARVGANEVDLYLRDRAAHEMDMVTVSATLPEKGIGPIAMEAMKAGPGHYMVDAATLGAPGTWTLHVVHQISDFDQYEQRVRIAVH